MSFYKSLLFQTDQFERTKQFLTDIENSPKIAKIKKIGHTSNSQNPLLIQELKPIHHNLIRPYNKTQPILLQKLINKLLLKQFLYMQIFLILL